MIAQPRRFLSTRLIGSAKLHVELITRGAGVGAPFIAEVKIISWNFAPRGWAFCNGQTMAINQNQTLFSLIGTSYGGDGISTFNLPNLQARTPVHTGGPSGYVTGSNGGEESHTLVLGELPVHIHSLQGATAAGTVNLPAGNYLAGAQIYHSPDGSNAPMMNAASIKINGGSESHENRQPYLVLNFIIALQGMYPSRG
jgi:microcystin-dependent protein